jgi:hypothetical protein
MYLEEVSDDSGNTYTCLQEIVFFPTVIKIHTFPFTELIGQ